MQESYLNDEQYARGGIEGTVVQSYDGGSVRAEEVPHLDGRVGRRFSESKPQTIYNVSHFGITVSGDKQQRILLMEDLWTVYFYITPEGP